MTPSPLPPPVSAVILFKDALDTLPRTLDSLRELDEVLVFDNGPTQGLEHVCTPYSNVRIVLGEFVGFGPTRNHAAQLARNHWIFMVDADEWIDPELFDSLKQIDPEQTQQVFAVTRRNIYLGKEMRWGRWKPHRIMRLYHRNHTQYNDRQVHEGLQIPANSEERTLAGVLWHESIRSVEQELEKINRYTELAIEDSRRPSSPWGAMARTIWRFIKAYVLELGMLDGWRGLLCAVNTANTGFYKHIKRVAAHTTADNDRP